MSFDLNRETELLLRWMRRRGLSVVKGLAVLTSVLACVYENMPAHARPVMHRLLDEFKVWMEATDKGEHAERPQA